MLLFPLAKPHWPTERCIGERGVPVTDVLLTRIPTKWSDQQFLYIFTLGKWSFMLSYQTAHLIKSKHIYHLIKACFMATPRWCLRWKYLSNSSSSGTSVRGTLWQAMEILISQYKNNVMHNMYLRGHHWWLLLVCCGYWVLLMCLLELSRWTPWMDRCQKKQHAY